MRLEKGMYPKGENSLNIDSCLNETFVIPVAVTDVLNGPSERPNPQDRIEISLHPTLQYTALTPQHIHD